jgi:hypothetical protein
MVKDTHITTVGDRVRLKDTAVDLYEPWGVVGNVGIVKAQKHDKYGYALVYIAWDKRHWAYNGAKDQWTFESHFEVVKDKDMGSEQDKALADAFRAAIKSNPELLDLLKENEKSADEVVAETTPEPDTDPIEDPPVEEERKARGIYDQEHYMTLIESASKSLDESSAMAVVVVNKQTIEDDTVMVPTAYVAATDEIALDLVQMQVPKIAAMLVEAMVIDRIEARGLQRED